MTIKRLVLWVTFLSILAMAARISMDTDTWWHLRTGAYILEHGEIPTTDPFSYTRAGADWRIPGWLVQVPMVWMYNLGGPGLLNLWVAAMVTLAFALIYRTLEGGTFLKAFVLILAAAASGVYWAARPYMVTFVLMAVFLWILEDWRTGRRDRLWWLPVLMVVWANSHGGFAAGVILWGVYAVGAASRRVGESANQRIRESASQRVSESASQRVSESADLRDEGLVRATPEGGRGGDLKKLVLVGVVMIAAVAISPAGPGMLLYPFKTVGIASLREFIQEWQSPNLHERQVWPFAALLMLTFGAVGASDRRLSLTDFLLVAGWGFMGLLAGRNIALFSLAAPIVLARHAAPVVERWSARLGVHLNPDRRPSRGMGILNSLLAALVLLAAGVKAASVYPREVNEAQFSTFLPVEAVEFLRAERPDGRLFNSYNWGAYLLWALPEYPVFVDGRTDLYSDEVIEEWFTVVRAEAGWEEILEQWEVNLVLIEPGMPIAAAASESGWREMYQDEVAVLLVMRPQP